jgi:putative flippase GtrA
MLAPFGQSSSLRVAARWVPASLTLQTVRYAALGIVCALGHCAVMIAGDFAGYSYVTMTVIAYFCVTPFAYLGHAACTFNEEISVRGFLRFASGVALGFPLSFLSMAIFCSGLGMPVVIAAPATTVVLFLWNYVSAHWAIRGSWRIGRPADQNSADIMPVGAEWRKD